MRTDNRGNHSPSAAERLPGSPATPSAVLAAAEARMSSDIRTRKRTCSTVRHFDRPVLTARTTPRGDAHEIDKRKLLDALELDLIREARQSVKIRRADQVVLAIAKYAALMAIPVSGALATAATSGTVSPAVPAMVPVATATAGLTACGAWVLSRLTSRSRTRRQR